MFEVLQVSVPLLGEIAMPHLLLIIGLVLIVLEAMSPGAYLIVIGVALAGAGLLGLLLPVEASIFVLSAFTLVIGFAAAWVYREFDFYGGKGMAQTSDSGSLAGATGYVTETVTARGGQVKLEGGGFTPFYSARSNGGTIEEGERIIVLDPGGGNVLTVEDMSAIETDEIDRALAREASAAEPTDETADPGVGSETESEPGPETKSETESETESER